eukprot:TRINITY_DN7456_c0_g1_i4.p1 TRINITY_DN7456_c0_g1~~TRINITY_DN7456_c0_g1_i4.p1  ORF type:complete len:133 (+),score=7.57 TRINITY_DN7456_c0_g1_i4:223-621(+)
MPSYPFRAQRQEGANNRRWFAVCEVDRCTEIERENRILVEKISQIMQFRRGLSCRPLGKRGVNVATAKTTDKRSTSKDQRKNSLLKMMKESRGEFQLGQTRHPEDYRIRYLKNTSSYPFKHHHKSFVNRSVT